MRCAWILVGAASVLALASGCGGSGSKGDSSDAGADASFTPCAPPKPGDLDTQYLFALSLEIGGNLQPAWLFLADLKTVAPQGGGTALEMTLHSLRATDRKTVVGSPFVAPAVGIGSDGVLEKTPFPDFTITGEADAVDPGKNVVVSGLTLIGQMCGARDFYCGTVVGKVTAPIVVQLAGSPYTFQRVPDPNSLPLDPIFADCAKDTVPPPP